TACLDAIMVGKPVVFIPDSVGDDSTPLPIIEEAIASGAALAAQNAQELAKRLAQLFNSGEITTFHERTKLFAAKVATYLGEEAAQRTAHIIKTACNR